MVTTLAMAGLAGMETGLGAVATETDPTLHLVNVAVIERSEELQEDRRKDLAARLSHIFAGKR